MSDVPPLDPHLRAALRHAPDAAIEPPAALDERILRAALATRTPPDPGTGSLRRRLVRGLTRLLDAARAPVPAAALGSLALATVIVALWGPGLPPQDEPLPPSPAAADLSLPQRQAPAAAPAAPVPPERQALSLPGPAPSPTPAPAAPNPARVQLPAPVPPPTPATEPLAQRSTELSETAMAAPGRTAATAAATAAPAAAPAPVVEAEAPPAAAPPPPAPRTLQKSAPPSLASTTTLAPADDGWASRPRDAAPEGGRPWRHPVDGQAGRLVVVDRQVTAQAEVWWIPDAGPAWQLVLPADRARRWREHAEGRSAGPPGPWPPAATASGPR